MSFKEWLFSLYPNPHIDGQYGLLHIITMVFIAALVVVSTLLLKKKSEKTKRIFLCILAAIILTFEIARRVINFCKGSDFTVNSVLHILLPRPGCAISCWLVILAVIINKKFFYNFASIISIICAAIFFAYPGVGFNNEYILFENLYSIITHSLFFAVSICFITLNFTDFKYKDAWKELICLAVMIIYVWFESQILKIEADPFYCLPGNDIQEIVSLAYGAFITIYLIFVTLYFNLFYLIGDRKNVFKKRFKKK